MNVGFVSRKSVSGDHAVERVDRKGRFGLSFEHVVEALEPAGLIHFQGVTVFLEIATGDTGGFVQRGDIGRSAVVDAGLGTAEEIELIQINPSSFGDLDTRDGLAGAVESRGSGSCGGDGDKFCFFHRDQAGGGAVGSGLHAGGRGELETHLGSEPKGSRANLQVASGFKNQHRFRFFLPRRIDQRLGRIGSSGGEGDAVDFFFRPGDERGFGWSENVFCQRG